MPHGSNRSKTSEANVADVSKLPDMFQVSNVFDAIEMSHSSDGL